MYHDEISSQIDNFDCSTEVLDTTANQDGEDDSKKPHGYSCIQEHVGS